MFKISQSQMVEFSKESLITFENRMIELFKKHWARAFAEHGEQRFRELIRAETPYATSYGLRCEQDVGHYLNLMVAVCISLDMDPRGGWITKIMTDPESSPTTKLYDLYGKVATRYDSTIARGER